MAATNTPPGPEEKSKQGGSRGGGRLSRLRGRGNDKPEGSAGPGRQGRGAGAGVAAGVAGGVGGLVLLLARLVRVVVGLIVLIIVVAILLRVLDANSKNTLVHDIHNTAKSLVGPFKNVFTNKHPKISIAINWGLAAVVYAAVGFAIASALARFGLAGRARAEGAGGRERAA